MRLFLVLAVYLVTRADSAHAILRRRSHETHDYFALQLRPQAFPEEAALNLGLRHEGSIGELPNHHAFSVPKDSNTADILRCCLSRERRTMVLKHPSGHQTGPCGQPTEKDYSALYIRQDKRPRTARFGGITGPIRGCFTPGHPRPILPRAMASIQHGPAWGRPKCYGVCGTSAAGVIALALSVRPDLTWRDVQYLLVETAAQYILPMAVGIQRADGCSAMTGDIASLTHMPLFQGSQLGIGQTASMASFTMARGGPGNAEGHQGQSSYYEVSLEMLRMANLEQLEHVTVTINVNHTRRGDLSVELVSPSGVVSYLSTPRMPDMHKTGYQDWEFMSVAHWGETGVGTWRVIVKDTNVNGHTGAFINWRLNLWGEAVDGPNQPLHPSPGDPMVYITEVAVISTTSSPLPTPAVIHSPSDWGSATRPWRQPDMGVSGTLLALLTLCSALAKYAELRYGNFQRRLYIQSVQDGYRTPSNRCVHVQ
ncbi:hypothetical protein ASPSYDRAFT_35930 [Aspergillus sydowii CBS 593.65]|uniref:P/Homo B domain-containing protein n=1 Tax=Aspergillus sydowii CBS 593.65 TaxID=1036612 RepID=A0A1L9T2R7_9EURO|nr:uncharacterized protein ASPSYDRAFT_35930 [Aspergillus sydowii CBS 593.65]OJJ53685.1 hypothetical protein ASPSYDRAFT_35930 [Aspergillus sydowii CBS 593.65]